MKTFDVIIVGSGPIGITCGIEAKKRNLSHLIIDKGCLVNSLFHYPTNMTFFSTSDRLEIGDVPFVSHGDKPTRRESLEYYRRVTDVWQLDVNTYENVNEIVNKDGLFIVQTSKNKYSAKNIIVATGFFDHANMLNVPGENLPKVKHYFTEAHPYAYLNVAVIGGGNSAVDVALETFRRRSKVTMIVREPNLKESVKYWVKPDIENRIKEGSIKALFNSEVKEIRSSEIDVQTPHGLMTLKNDFVFAMTGYHPDYTFLGKIGVNVSGDELQIPLIDQHSFESNITELYLAGVVCGGMETNKWFIENSRDHAGRIFNHIQKL